MKQIVFILFIFMSHSTYADCLPAYKQRAAFKLKRAKEDTSAAAYTKVRAREAQSDVDNLEMIILGKINADTDRLLFSVCSNIIWSWDIPDRDFNSDKHCPIGEMFKRHKKFVDMVIQKNKNNEYCKPKEISWIKSKMRGDRGYPVNDYNFNLQKEFEYYLKNIYMGN